MHSTSINNFVASSFQTKCKVHTGTSVKSFLSGISSKPTQYEVIGRKDLL